MDLDFSQEQVMFRTTCRDFLSKECPGTLVRELESSEGGYSPELWRKIADLGWLGLTFPEKYGGLGGDFIDLAILYDEMGRANFPSSPRPASGMSQWQLPPKPLLRGRSSCSMASSSSFPMLM